VQFTLRLFIFLAVCLLASFSTDAAEFSNSLLKPASVEKEGVMSAAFPPGGERMAYYFSVDLQKGDLLTQISFKGRPGSEKRVEFALLDANASLISAYWIQGAESQKGAARQFPIEKSGLQVLRLTVSGPQTDEFRVELGGRAFPSSSASK
jgi:hypothetical protein